MIPETTYFSKEYSEPFVLDRGKLSRMVTILEKKRTTSSDQPAPSFEVVFQNNKRIVLHSIQDVLALDNSLGNPIVSLAIDLEGPTPNDAKAKPFMVTNLRFGSGRLDNISLRVVSYDNRVATEVFAELEEQVDRAVVSSWVAKSVKSGQLALVAFFGLVLTAVVFAATFVQKETPTLPATDRAELQRLLTQARSDSEKIDALVQAQLGELKVSQRSDDLDINWSTILSLRTVFIALPVLVLVITVIYLILTCYPWAVFAWGDWEQKYNALVARRKTLIGVVLTTLILGIMAGLFVASIPPVR